MIVTQSPGAFLTNNVGDRYYGLTVLTQGGKYTTTVTLNPTIRSVRSGAYFLILLIYSTCIDVSLELPVLLLDSV